MLKNTTYSLHLSEHDGKDQFHFLLTEVPVQPAIFIIRRAGSLFQQVNQLSVGLHQK